ncbi:hypothetical protein AVDCRST_MAG92-1153, partial [uncultured Coleofasciculus sp.]
WAGVDGNGHKPHLIDTSRRVAVRAVP